MRTLNQYYAAWIDSALMPTAIRVALVVGTFLFILNHGSALLEGKMNRDRWLAGLVTYLVPYTVSMHGQHVARSKFSDERDSENLLSNADRVKRFQRR